MAAPSEFGRLIALLTRSPTGEEVDVMATGTERTSKFERERAKAVERLVREGASRLTAERILEIERGQDGAGRARRHATAHR
jgi:hypothetical protein